jgi:hypothetical protein
MVWRDRAYVPAGHGHAGAIRVLGTGGARLDAHAATIDLPDEDELFGRRTHFSIRIVVPRGLLMADRCGVARAPS